LRSCSGCCCYCSTSCRLSGARIGMR
jgi:hypothetical protein